MRKLLQEDSYVLLNEDGSAILLELPFEQVRIIERALQLPQRELGIGIPQRELSVKICLREFAAKLKGRGKAE